MFPDDVDEAEEGEVVAAEVVVVVAERGKEDDVGLCSDATDATTDVTKYCHAPCFHRSMSLAQTASVTTTTTSKSGGHDMSDVIELRV